MKVTASDVLAASMLCSSRSDLDLDTLVWKVAISLLSKAPNLLKVSLCQESYLRDTLLWTLAKSMMMGPNSRRVSEVSNVDLVVLRIKVTINRINTNRFKLT